MKRVGKKRKVAGKKKYHGKENEAKEMNEKKVEEKVMFTPQRPLTDITNGFDCITPPQIIDSKWSQEQVDDLHKAIATVPPYAPLFWKEVGARVEGKTWFECFHYHTKHCPKEKKEKKKKKDSPLNSNSNFNTAKSRRKARNLLKKVNYKPTEDAFENEKIRKDNPTINDCDNDSESTVDSSSNELSKLLNNKDINSPLLPSNKQLFDFDRDKLDNFISRHSKNLKKKRSTRKEVKNS